MRTSHRLIFNSLSTYARLLGTFAIGLFLTPFLGDRERMGIDGLGLYLLLMSSVGLITILRATVNGSMVREISAAFNDPSEGRLDRIFAASVVSALLLGLFMGGVMALCTPLALKIFQFPDALMEQMKWSWLTLSVFTFWVIVAVPFITLFSASQRVPLGNLEMFLERAATLVAAVYVFSVPFGHQYPLFSYILFSCGFIMLVQLLSAVFAYFSTPEVHIRLSALQWGEVLHIFRVGSHVGKQEVATNLYDRTNQLLINLFLGPVLNGLFGAVVLVVGYTKQISMGIAFGVEPYAAKFAANENNRKSMIGSFILSMTRVQSGVIFPIVAVLSVLGPVLVNFWLGTSFSDQWPGANADIANLVSILLIGSPFFVIMEGTLRIMLGAGDVKAYANTLFYAGLVQACLAVLTLWGIKELGSSIGWEQVTWENIAMYAVVTGMSIVYLFTYGVLVPCIACHVYDIAKSDMYIHSLLPGGVLGLLAAGISVGLRVLIPQWTKLEVLGAVVGVGSLCAVLFWVFILSGDEQDRLLELVRIKRPSTTEG